MPSSAPTSPEEEADYQAWKAMGPGGVSATYEGYLLAEHFAKTLAHENTQGLEVYHRPEEYATGWADASEAQKEAAYRSFLSEPLPQRPGPQARATPWVFPQRQQRAASSQSVDSEVRETYSGIFNSLATSNPNTNADLEYRTSLLEKHGPALFLSSNSTLPLTPLATPSKREICHIHASDLSGHVTLSFADAEEVIAKGWGERHRLSGTEALHLGYTLLYAPRTVGECEVLGRVMGAGVRFMGEC